MLEQMMASVVACKINVPNILGHFNIWSPSWWHCLGSLEMSDIAEGGTSLGCSLNFKSLILSSVCSLIPAPGIKM